MELIIALIVGALAKLAQLKWWPFCEYCGAVWGVKSEYADTAYHWDGKGENPNRNLHLCRFCADDYHQYWADMWADYRSMVRGIMLISLCCLGCAHEEKWVPQREPRAIDLILAGQKMDPVDEKGRWVWRHKTAIERLEDGYTIGVPKEGKEDAAYIAKLIDENPRYLVGLYKNWIPGTDWIEFADDHIGGDFKHEGVQCGWVLTYRNLKTGQKEEIGILMKELHPHGWSNEEQARQYLMNGVRCRPPSRSKWICDCPECKERDQSLSGKAPDS